MVNSSWIMGALGAFMSGSALIYIDWIDSQLAEHEKHLMDIKIDIATMHEKIEQAKMDENKLEIRLETIDRAQREIMSHINDLKGR